MHLLTAIRAIGIATMKGGLRDRLVQSLLLAGFFFLFSTVAFSSFSMRQPLEVAINYSLATVHILAVLITLFLGLNLLSREIENRAGHGVLTQPLSRSGYVLGKFFGLVLLCGIIVAFLAACAVAGVLVVRAGIADAPPMPWANFGMALVGILCIAVLLGAATLFFYAVATSAILPFLATIAVWVIGNSTQTVKNYLDANMADPAMSQQLKAIITGAYYAFPNLSLLDFKVYAIYGLPLATPKVVFALVYGLVYTGLLLALATRLFQKRDLL